MIVDGTVRGALLVGSLRHKRFRLRLEDHIGDFADLVSTAIANAETRAELTASRARIVAAADEARRGFERDLHDGAQQRIVSLSLELRAIEAAAVADDALRGQLSTRGRRAGRAALRPAGAVAGHASGGAVPRWAQAGHQGAGATLGGAGRTGCGRRPPAAGVGGGGGVLRCRRIAHEHRQARERRLGDGQPPCLDGVTLRLSVADDGAGGATAGGGSGLVGLRDRVDAMSGELAVTSTPGEGTTVTAVIPLGED